LFLNYRRNEDEGKYLFLNYRRNEDEAKYSFLNYQRLLLVPTSGCDVPIVSAAVAFSMLLPASLFLQGSLLLIAYCVGGPVVASIPAVACVPAVVSSHDIASFKFLMVSWC
jgi:hypothetical protein